MKLVIFAAIVALSVNLGNALDPHEHNKVVCYWNSTSFERLGAGKFKLDDLKPALEVCTHLVYGFAGIEAGTFKAISLHPSIDTGAGFGFYKQVTQLKRTYPAIKFYLSIGGNDDPYEETHKYLTLLESKDARNEFIKSVSIMLNEYDFDGVDLAWQFPPVKYAKKRNAFVSFWHKIKKTFGYGNFHDEKEEEHKTGFTNLVRDLKGQLRTKNKDLTITVLPHVNATVYYDIRLLQPNIDAVHLMTFDQKNPERNPDEADYPAPIYESYGRTLQDNIDFNVRYWLEHGTPGGKIVIGVPSFARTWKLTEDSQISGVPPIVADGPGAAGPHTAIPGLLSYAEVCARLTESAVGGRVKRVNDPSKKYGGYAYQSYNKDTSAEGMWIGFEDPETAGNKASYAKAKGLGGVAIFDLSTDDFRGNCNGDKFPIVKAAKYKL
ncbi:hypothetical protein HCN44_003511 [Aphidius gifuensis]|uniref:GH18 domain-containing protein n=1 Tax=Aphidius gifuensis TaxID=684658 RepID=A0A835CN08_APHGI|nr:chitinase-like protein Idgf4 [Aphidius gifuensis]KAF7987648.1 hypothetical protein HCN44_003511 [Aphidius gifuensis]